MYAHEERIVKDVRHLKDNRFRTKLNNFFEGLSRKKEKKPDALQEAYRKKYDEVYREEREKYLIEKAERDAKIAARKNTGILAIIDNMITGGRGLK